MPGLCLARESPETQGFSLLQKTLSSILGQKVVQQPQQTTRSLEKPATTRERRGNKKYTEEPGKRNRWQNQRKDGRETRISVFNGGKKKESKRRERGRRGRLQLAVAAVQLLTSQSSSLAAEQQGQSIKRVHPAITSPLNVRQPGAPCNCVSHQPAITFKGATLALLETQAGHTQVLHTHWLIFGEAARRVLHFSM